tara:strand:- start:990 stop:1370 length:381 start_codon:yes stop_codon:yes gene_type:complete
MNGNKMVGYLIPYWNKGSDTFNANLTVRKSQYAKYLGGLTLVTNLGCDGFEFSESASINVAENMQWERVKKACEEYFTENNSAFPWYTATDDTAVKVMFDFGGIDKNYKDGVTYTNIVVKNIELVQ